MTFQTIIIVIIITVIIIIIVMIVIIIVVVISIMVLVLITIIATLSLLLSSCHRRLTSRASIQDLFPLFPESVTFEQIFVLAMFFARMINFLLRSNAFLLSFI